MGRVKAMVLFPAFAAGLGFQQVGGEEDFAPDESSTVAFHVGGLMKTKSGAT